MFAPAQARRRPVVVLASGAAVVALALSGCAAGQQAQTVQQTSVVDGQGLEIGNIAVRDAGVAPPPNSRGYAAGDSAAIQGLVINAGQQADELVSVVSPDADQALFFADGVTALQAYSTGSSGASASPSLPAGAVSPTATPSASATVGQVESTAPQQTPSGDASTSPVASAATSGSAGGSAGASPTTSVAVTPSGGPTTGGAGPLTSLALVPGESLSIGYSNQSAQIVLIGLKRAIAPGQTISLTFTFAKAGSGTKLVAVKLPVDSTVQAPTVSAAVGQGE